METNGYRLLLPEGTLDYFTISDVKESSTEIVIYLEGFEPQADHQREVFSNEDLFFYPCIMQNNIKSDQEST